MVLFVHPVNYLIILYCIVFRVGMWRLFRRVIYSNNFWAVHFLSFGCADRRLVSIIVASNAVRCRISAASQQFISSASIALHM